MNDEIDRRNQTSLDLLQQSMSQTVKELEHTTSELVDSLAWDYQVQRTTLKQRQSLIGYAQTIKKMGKGFGKKVPKLGIEARKLMNEAQSAVPVWIMPLSRVVESFNAATTKFDVVIIDEASQLDSMGLIAQYLGKQIVVVGDDQQVSPDAVGEKLDDVEALIEEHLTDIPNKHLYDGKQSIYDIASRSLSAICLREHFRCVSDIIQFSNRLSYDGKIEPLRDSSSVVTVPYVVEYRVEGTISDNNVNEKEAVTIASLIAGAIEQSEYADQSFGVISLLGEEQARQIETYLRAHISPAEFEQRRLMCGTPPQFQGDERDIMFLSVVSSPKDGPLPMRQESNFKKRVNVAASRARNQMWVVHSLNSGIDLKTGDLRRQLIEHAKDPREFENQFQYIAQDTESDFETQVLRRLIAKGYNIKPQYKVGAYRIDMVVQYENKQLAIECDGDRYHTLDKLDADMQRQAILERLGWTFVRIRGSEFYRNPETAMVPVFERLEKMEIIPTFEYTNPSQDIETDLSADTLKERVIRRAAQLRSEWEEPDEIRLENEIPIENEIPNTVFSSLRKRSEYTHFRNPRPCPSLEIRTRDAGQRKVTVQFLPSEKRFTCPCHLFYLA